MTTSGGSAGGPTIVVDDLDLGLPSHATLTPPVETEPAVVQHAPGATIVGPDPTDAPTPRLGRSVPVPPPPRRPAPPEARVAASPERATPLHRGARLGRWILEEPLGDGATAAVWSARHEQLGAPVAIKIFHRQDLPFHAVLGEARAAAGIPSRNTIWVYDVDSFGGHRAIVMELCADEHGRATSLREAELHDPRVAARVIAEAARGVAAAHECDVFHKDIKPANILLNPSDGRAQIADFGLANPALWQAPAGGAGRTAQATVLVDKEVVPADAHDPWAAVRGSLRLGTPEFMAPEQAAGLRRNLDPADPVDRRHLVALDVYGLGATLWYLLVGRSPYPIDPAADVSAEAIMDEVVARPPVALRRAAPGVPRRLARIVERAMHRDPLQRYATAAALADDLEAWTKARPTSFDRTRVSRAGVHLWRERARVGLLAALALVTIGSSVVVGSNAREIADQQADLAAMRADKERVLRDLAAADDALVGAHAQLEAKDGLLQERGHELADREARLASTSQALDTTRVALTTRGAALEQALAQVASTEASLQSVDEQLADARAALDRSRQDAAAAHAEVAQLQGRRDDLQDQVLRLGQDLAGQRAAVDRLVREQARDQQRAEGAEAQVRLLRKEVQRLREAAAAAEVPPLPQPGWQELAPAPTP